MDKDFIIMFDMVVAVLMKDQICLSYKLEVSNHMKS